MLGHEEEESGDACITDSKSVLPKCERAILGISWRKREEQKRTKKKSSRRRRRLVGGRISLGCGAKSEEVEEAVLS